MPRYTLGTCFVTMLCSVVLCFVIWGLTDKIIWTGQATVVDFEDNLVVLQDKAGRKFKVRDSEVVQILVKTGRKQFSCTIGDSGNAICH